MDDGSDIYNLMLFLSFTSCYMGHFTWYYKPRRTSQVISICSYKSVPKSTLVFSEFDRLGFHDEWIIWGEDCLAMGNGVAFTWGVGEIVEAALLLLMRLWRTGGDLSHIKLCFDGWLLCMGLRWVEADSLLRKDSILDWVPKNSPFDQWIQLELWKARFAGCG